jgi:acetyltransferase-like isoleucine patch superfamily enzyme
LEQEVSYVKKESLVKKDKAYIHPTAVVEPGAELGPAVRVWHFCHVRGSAALEAGVSLGKDVYVDKNVRVGQGTKVQNGVSLYEGVKIAPWCFIGPNVIFTNDLKPRSGRANWEITETILETGASLCAGAIIRCGVTIGAFAMVGAGAVVTKSVPPFHLAVGIPACVTKKVCACGQTVLPLKTAKKELVRTCCGQSLDPEVLKAAKALIAKHK